MNLEEIVAPDAAEVATFPVTVRRLIAATAEKGGTVTMVCRGFAGQHLEFRLPRRMVGGSTPLCVAGAVGWHKGHDGRNKISAGVHDVRYALAKWRS